jgi:sirohydrochlorin cobaltochelatase
MAPRQAIILFAHGSRDPLWREPLEAVARRIEAQAPGVPVRCAYLELMTPDLPTAARELVGGGARHLRVVPMFLGVGKHAREDLPVLLAQLRLEFPEVVFEQRMAIGEEPQVVDLLARIALENSNS